jgi:hypothetical protein
MASLTGQTIADTYKRLLTIDSENFAADASAKYIKDGDAGTSSILSLSTTRVGIGTASPSKMLHVYDGDAGTDPLAIFHNAGSNEDASISLINDAQTITLGVDGSDSDKFKISDNTALGTNDRLTMDTSGNITLSGNLTLGVDDTGVDFRVYSATASEGLLYDASQDELALLLTTKLKFHDVGGGEEIFASADGHLEINAGTTLDITAPTVDLNSATEFNIDTVLYDLNASGATTLNGVPVTITSTGDITLDSDTDIVLDAAGGNFEFKDAGVAQLTIDVDSTGGDINIDLEVNGDDLVFRQYDATEVMRITDNGRVGIGEAAPDAPLCINQGALDVEILTFKSSDIAHGMTDFTETDTWGRFQKQSATLGGLSMTGQTETGGVSSVSIGGYSTDETDVRSSSASAPIILNGRTKSGSNVANMGADKNIVVIRNNATTRFIFDSDGDAHADGGSGFTVYSDSRLKTDIETIPYGLAEVLQLQPKKFKKASGSFDEDGNVALEDNARVSIGFIAQELKLIIPEMVKEIDETSSFYGLNVGQVTPVLVKAIQELSASNDALKARIEVLEAA